MNEDQQIEKTAQGPDPAKAPSGIARVVQETFMGAVRSGPTFHPIFDKFESQHVTQFLQDASESDADRRKMERGNRWFRLVYVAIGVAIFCVLTWTLLPEHSDLYFQLLQGAGIFIAGLLGGYGIRSHQENQ